MDDPIQRHPTRAEQLDIMAGIVADMAQPGDRLLDLGCGTGYFVHLLEAKRADLTITGVDLKPESLAAARARFPSDRFAWVAGDLGAPGNLALPHDCYRFIVSGLTFHDLADLQKQLVIGLAARLLTDDGLFLLYDRLRLTEPKLFPAQQSIWRRLERLHGFGMRTAADFAAYEADLGTANAPARLDDYRRWFSTAGLAHAVLHQHGNIAVLAAARRA